MQRYACVAEKEYDSRVRFEAGYLTNKFARYPLLRKCVPADFHPYGSKLPTEWSQLLPAFKASWLCWKERRVDALALRADERRDKLRKASGRSKYPTIRRSLNGETWLRKPQSSIRQSITYGREPGELKHLSSRRKRKQHVISKVAASEMERAQTGMRASRGSDRTIDSMSLAEWFWESQPKRVKAP